MSRLARQKNPLTITDDTRRAVDLVVADPYKAEYFGSFVYRAQLYPGDIDVHEVIEEEGKGDIYRRMARILQEETRRVFADPLSFYSEIKAGTDARFMIPTDKRFPQHVQKIKHLLANDEYAQLLHLYELDERELKEALRQLQVLRWKSGEILRGIKKLRGGQKITLEDALKTPGHIKIDIHTPVDGRYVEVTNFWYLVRHLPGQRPELMNLPDKNYVQQLQQQIKEYFSGFDWNPFKGAKRMWGLARASEDKRLFRALTPLFQGGIARMNQIKSETDTLILMLEQNTREELRPAMPLIRRQIDGWRGRLSNVEFEYPEDKLMHLIDTAKKELSVQALEKVHELLAATIDNETLRYLKAANLYPPPPYLFRIPPGDADILSTPFFKQALNID